MTTAVLSDPCIPATRLADVELLSARVIDLAAVLQARESPAFRAAAAAAPDVFDAAIRRAAGRFGEALMRLDAACEAMAQRGQRDRARLIQHRTMAAVRSITNSGQGG
jgi:hypothetical protein